MLRLEAAAAAAEAAAAEAERNAPVEVASSRANQVFSLGDGRFLSYAEAGDPNGFPVLCFFGIGGSRYLVLLLDDVARQFGLRVISPDRPGFGRSTILDNRTFSDFGQDVESLCDFLNIQKMGIWSYSVGCAYAAVCCLQPRLKQRLVAKITLISPWVPLTAPGVPMHFSIARFFPHSVAEFLKPQDVSDKRAELKRRGQLSSGQSTDDTIKNNQRALSSDNLAMSAPSAGLYRFGVASEPTLSQRSSSANSYKKQQSVAMYLCGTSFFDQDEDKATHSPFRDDSNELTDAEMRALETLPRGPRLLLASIIESQIQGGRGFSEEFRLCCSDFDFDYQDMNWPCRVYHGTDDNLLSTHSVRWLVSRIRSKLPDDRHVELFQVLGGTHNGMVFAILKRSLSAIAQDIKTKALAVPPFNVNFETSVAFDTEDPVLSALSSFEDCRIDTNHERLDDENDDEDSTAVEFIHS
mmetsp:Transcript_21185/g.25474  ORF Transcript_21185/g.25474 Transcript_21185/m.25474 type:complete len:467 (+) Transcript_21185:61-1461(+)